MKEMRKPTADSATPGTPHGATRSEPPDAKPPAAAARTDVGRVAFRTRIFRVLLLFALVPTIAVTLLWAGVADRTLAQLSTGRAWERIARTGDDAMSALREAPLTPRQRQALEAHEAELRQSVQLAKRLDFVAPRAMRLVLVGAALVVLVVAVGASRAAGHLSRQLSRPLDELVGWTRLLRDGAPLPARSTQRGAPEFELLRQGMRTMATELEAGRRRALEAERAEAFRESARRFAHELKNPLTPIRFAIARLRRSAPDDLQETVEVLAEESARLDAMARSFAQFGRLPEGPAAEIDLGDLVTRAARSTVPDTMALDLDVEPELPLVTGLHEPLVRAVSNVLLNAVEATDGRGTIRVRVGRDRLEGREAIVIAIGDDGPGMPPEVASRAFDPYVTSKPGGTGLGLAIARQTIEAHRGAIDASSAPGRGTTVSLRVPVHAPGGA
jgi:signal transduction histidine kinase